MMIRRHFRRSPCATGLIVLVLVSLLGLPLGAQEDSATSVIGVTTSQASAVLLPGVHVRLLGEGDDRVVAETDSDEKGAYRFARVIPGRYRVRGSLAEFQDVVSPPVQVRSGQSTRVDLDLPLAARSESLTVTPETSAATLPATVVSHTLRPEDIQLFTPVSGSDVQNMLSLMPSAIRGPGGAITINGGRSTQTRVLIDDATIIDPTTGGADIDLPSEAVQSVEVLPNPVDGEFGRLSAGIIRFQTRRGPDRWHFTASDFIPEPRFRNGLNIQGIRTFFPRLFAGGPILKDRLFIAQSLVVEHSLFRVDGLEDIKDTTASNRIGSFTRIDAPLSARHLATVSFGAFPRHLDNLFIGHFLPPASAPDLRQTSYLLAASERATLASATVLESAISLRDADVKVFGNGTDPMVLTPDGRQGSFFNQQDRDTRTLQWKETLSLARDGRTGQHLFKVGTDLLLSQFDGTSTSRAVEIRRVDGTLAERIDFSGLSRQSAGGADGAIFVADDWKPAVRVQLNPSARLEFDRISGRAHLAPRIGSAFGLTSDGASAVRGGIGRFYERAPLLTTSFGAFEEPTISRFGPDGSTPAGPPVRYTNQVAPGLNTPSALIWNLGYDHKLNKAWLVSASYLERLGSDELQVDRDDTGGPGGIGRLVLESNGRSRYREVALWAQYQHQAVRATASYVWSRSRADLNPVDASFGNFRDPLMRRNDYGPTATDVPNRIVGWGTVPLGHGFGLSAVGEWRTGFPYSIVDQFQEYVGPRNSLRLPDLNTLDLTAFRDTTLGGHRVRLILRVYRALNTYNPREVQNNLASPAFGTLYSTARRRIALDIDFLH
jgi:hypothetical protein